MFLTGIVQERSGEIILSAWKIVWYHLIEEFLKIFPEIFVSAVHKIASQKVLKFWKMEQNNKFNIFFIAYQQLNCW